MADSTGSSSIPDVLKDLPERIQPYLLLGKVDEPVHILPGPFRLIGSSEGTLEGDLRVRWSPSTAVEFEGTYDRTLFASGDQEFFLSREGKTQFRVPVVLTYSSFGPKSSYVRGIVGEKFTVGQGPFQALRFCLANFPYYTGVPVRYEVGAEIGATQRLETRTDSGNCQLDQIHEAKDLAKSAQLDAGFVVSHVGMWVPAKGVLSVRDAESTTEMLHSWFGLLCGAWTGPLFPQGLDRRCG